MRGASRTVLDLSFLHKLEIEGSREIERIEAGIAWDALVVEDGRLLHERH